MALTPGLRNLVLTTHVASSVGWLGAVVAYLALVVAALTDDNPQIVPAAALAMERIGWLVLVPLSIASVLTGLIQALGTPWGLFRHYWVVFKLLLTAVATIILLLHMPTVSLLAEVIVDANNAHAHGLRGELVHAGGGLLLLLVTTTLSVYKPQGLTPYGLRRLRESGQGTQPRL